MIEGRSGLCFLNEAALSLRVSDLIVRQNLDRDEAIQACVAGFVDHTHAAFAELLDDFVVRDSFANHVWHHFVPAGTFCFNSSNQFCTTTICVGAACVCPLGLSIRKRWPSGDTS